MKKWGQQDTLFPNKPSEPSGIMRSQNTGMFESMYTWCDFWIFIAVNKEYAFVHKYL